MSETSSKESTVKPQRSDEGSPVSTPALGAEHLSRAVVGKVITNNISVQVHVGEILAVVGPSGSGKSSFLRLLNRLDEPTNGVVRLRGQDYRELVPEELRRRVGMVMQSAYLFPGTVAEKHQIRTKSARLKPSCRADCCSPPARRIVRISEARCEQPVRRGGPARVDRPHARERSGGSPPG